MADRPKTIGERLWDAEARLGVIILIEAAHDGETACEALDAFIEDDIEDETAQADLRRDWPEMAELLRVNLDEDDERWARRATVLEVFQRQCRKRYLVRLEHTLKTLAHRASDAVFPYGTWRSGWGYYTQRWCLVDSPEEAVDRAIEYAEQQKRAAWESYGKPAKKRRKRSG